MLRILCQLLCSFRQNWLWISLWKQRRIIFAICNQNIFDPFKLFFLLLSSLLTLAFLQILLRKIILLLLAFLKRLWNWQYLFWFLFFQNIFNSNSIWTEWLFSKIANIVTYILRSWSSKGGLISWEATLGVMKAVSSEFLWNITNVTNHSLSRNILLFKIKIPSISWRLWRWKAT